MFSTKDHAQAPFGVYKPAIVPQSSYSVPNISFSDPVEEIMREQAAQARAMEIVSSNIVTVEGINYISEIYAPLKVKIIQRRNGMTQFYCIGIKKNGKWSICNQEIVSLETMYNNATKESEKETILELMEYGNYLLIVNPNSEVYIIK